MATSDEIDHGGLVVTLHRSVLDFAIEAHMAAANFRAAQLSAQPADVRSALLDAALAAATGLLEALWAERGRISREVLR